MPFSTWVDLKTALTNWSARTNDVDLSNRLQDFIALAEARINNEPGFRLRDMITRATGSFTTGVSELAQPEGFLQVELFQVASNPVVVLEARPSAETVALDTGTVGNPRTYTIIGSNFQILPPPDDSYDYTLDYYATLPPLASAGQNWLLVKAPNLYLYASLMELWIYLQDDEQLARYTAAYEAERDKLIASERRARISTHPLIARVA